MSFVNAAGADVASDQVGVHGLGFMRISEAAWKLASLGQPGEHVQKLGAVHAIDFTTLLEWTLCCGTLGNTIRSKAFWKTRPEPSDLARFIEAALGALPAGTVKGPVTKGEWLELISTGCGKVGAENAHALVVDASFELPNTPPPPAAIPNTASDDDKRVYKEAAFK